MLVEAYKQEPLGLITPQHRPVGSLETTYRYVVQRKSYCPEKVIISIWMTGVDLGQEKNQESAHRSC